MSGLPSDNQGRFLAEVEMFPPIPTDKVQLAAHELDLTRVVLTREFAPLSCGPVRGVRDVKRTFEACLRREWITDEWFEVIGDDGLRYGCRETLLTEDGVIALGRWRQRLMNRPVERLVLEGDDREIIEAATVAARHGFVLAPCTDEARADARRLARGAFADRAWLSASTRGLQPTAIGVAEFPVPKEGQ